MTSACAFLRVNWPVVWAPASCGVLRAHTAGGVTTTEAKGLPDGLASLLNSSVSGLIQPSGKGRLSVHRDACPL